MIKNVLDAQDPNLRLKSKPVVKFDKKIAQIIKDLKDTISVQKDPEGIGLAAPQIGKRLRMFIMKPEKTITVVINPQIISMSKNKTTAEENRKIMEGCLSLPHYYGPLKRSKKVKVKYLDETGKPMLKEFIGLEAQIIQHEIDHLDGRLFIDRLLEQKESLYEFIDGEWEKVDLVI